MKAEIGERRAYFAASNSSGGFVNYFPAIFDREHCQRLFVIKGGPGTGKSSFLRRVAKEAESRGMKTIRYLCSSDAGSLDGVFIEDIAVGVIDGTPPHAWEPEAVGTFEQLLDLGEYWDQAQLFNNRAEIASLSNQKRICYQRAYEFLSAYGTVRRAISEDILKAVDQNKLDRACTRLFERYAPVEGKTKGVHVGLCDSFGMNGRVRLDTYEQLSRVHISVQGMGDIAHLVFARLYDLCVKNGVGVRVSYHPILAERIDALEFLDNGVVFSAVENEDAEAVVNMRRFVFMADYRNVRSSIRKAMHISDELLQCAEEQMLLAREAHFWLEEQFGAAMDFSRKEKREKDFCASLFGR